MEGALTVSLLVIIITIPVSSNGGRPALPHICIHNRELINFDGEDPQSLTIEEFKIFNCTEIDYYNGFTLEALIEQHRQWDSSPLPPKKKQVKKILLHQCPYNAGSVNFISSIVLLAHICSSR